MKQRIEKELDAFIDSYCEKNSLKRIWKTPIIKYADAKNPNMLRLKELISPSHYLPQDFLPEATTVLSYFLPFQEQIGASNVSGEAASSTWANAYTATNSMAVYLNLQLKRFIEQNGFQAAIPQNTSYRDGMLISDWSQRHIAYFAGHGTFGINNMLISDVGSCGRYFSIITSLPVAPGTPVTQERCLYKKNGTCGICLARCFSGALTKDGFDRRKCYDACQKNEAKYPGASVCGKCVVGLPCSFNGLL